MSTRVHHEKDGARMTMLVEPGLVAVIEELRTEPSARGQGRARALVSELLGDIYANVDVYAVLDPDDGEALLSSMRSFAAEFGFEQINSEVVAAVARRYGTALVHRPWAVGIVRPAPSGRNGEET